MTSNQDNERYNYKLEEKKMELSRAYLRAWLDYKRIEREQGILSPEAFEAFKVLGLAQKRYNRIADKPFR